MSKVMKCFKYILNSIILAGFIIFCIGLYYVAIKAGIPYQDPPLELQMQYAVNMGIGEELTKDGFWITFFGVVMRILIGVINRRKRRPSQTL